MTHDIDAGKTAGVVTVALAWGYQSRWALMSSNQDHYIFDISDLAQLLK